MSFAKRKEVTDKESIRQTSRFTEQNASDGKNCGS